MGILLARLSDHGKEHSAASGGLLGSSVVQEATTVTFTWIRFYYLSAGPEFFYGKDKAPFL